MQKKREFFLHQRVVGFRAYHAYLQLHSYPTNLKGAGPVELTPLQPSKCIILTAVKKVTRARCGSSNESRNSKYS